MRRRFRIYLICCVLVLLLFGCATPQEQKPTIQKLAEELVGTIKSSLTSPTVLDAYVKTLTSETNVLTEKSNLINSLRSTFSSLGNDVQLLNFYEFTSKSATPIYSFDLGMKPDVVDKVYIMNLLFINQAQQQKSVYSLPFITLQNEADKIYLAVIFFRDNNVVVYPKPIAP
ncbi:MAG: hypothetical protein PWQ90_368 [Pseudothermotoga sp.]|nr:hypothetical protein [Pseudothermotoga sp.]